MDNITFTSGIDGIPPTTLTLEYDEDNVIMFPNMKEGAPSTRQELNKLVIQNKIEVATDMSIAFTRGLVAGFMNVGVDVTEHENSGYDIASLLEIIKAMILRSSGVETGLLELTKEMIPLEEHDFTPKTFLSTLLGYAEE